MKKSNLRRAYDGARLATILIIVTLAACQADPLRPTATGKLRLSSANATERNARLMSTYDSTKVPGSVPGAFSRAIGRGTSINTGSDSVAWPRSFDDFTYVKLSVSGMISRVWDPQMNPGLNLAGTPYAVLDADAEFMWSQCSGDVMTNFSFSGDHRDNVSACRRSGDNPPSSVTYPPVQEYSVFGVVRGSGRVVRRGYGQPVYPASYYCTNLCVHTVAGSQQVTIEPWASWLLLSAVDSVNEGDVVSFVASGSSPFTNLTVQQWIWVPDVNASTNNPFLGGPRTIACAHNQSTCTTRVFEPGVMYVRAKAGPIPQRVEQARKAIATRPPSVPPTTCPTADSILDVPEVRSMMTELERISKKTTPPKEMAGYLFRLPDGSLRALIDSANSSNNCHTSNFNISLVPAGWMAIAGAHIHPGSIGAPAGCLPGFEYAPGPHGGIASPADWGVTQQGFPHVVMDPDSLVVLRPGTYSDSTQVQTPNGTKVWVPVPNSSEFPQVYSSFPRGGSCSRP